MNGIFRLRLPKLFFFSHPLFFFPKFHVWDTTLNFFFSSCMFPIFFCNSNLEKFYLITLQDLRNVFVFLGFLTLLANFGLVAPIPDGIRVLGVETPLRT